MDVDEDCCAVEVENGGEDMWVFEADVDVDEVGYVEEDGED